MKGKASRVFTTVDLSLLALSCSRLASQGMIKWSPIWEGERERVNAYERIFFIHLI
jgi:hypothetical protein